MKYHKVLVGLRRSVSLPARGVRVEMIPARESPTARTCHSPQGECGLKWNRIRSTFTMFAVTPRKGSAG